MHVLRRGMVAELLVITSQAKDVADAQRRGPQDIGLDGQPVAVATGHLQHRIHAFLFEDATGGDAGHAHHRRLVIGDVESIATILQHPRPMTDHAGVASLGRSQLRRHGEMPSFQHLFQIAAALHRPSSLKGNK